MLIQNFGVQNKNIIVFLQVANGICESREYYIYIDSVWNFDIDFCRSKMRWLRFKLSKDTFGSQDSENEKSDWINHFLRPQTDECLRDMNSDMGNVVFLESPSS